MLALPGYNGQMYNCKSYYLTIPLIHFLRLCSAEILSETLLHNSRWGGRNKYDSTNFLVALFQRMI